MAAIIILSLAIPGAWAQYTFTVIAETSNPGFSDFEQGYALGPTIDSQGRIVFVAYIIGRNPFFNAIYSRNGGALTTIADSIGTNLQTLTSPVISGWTVAFQAYIGGGGKESGIFTGNGGGLTTVVRTSDVTWAGFGTPPMNADGVMAFTAAEQILFDFNGHPIGGGTSGVYTSAAGTLAFTDVVNGVSRGIDRAVISSDGTVAYLQQVDTNLNGAIHLRGSANTIIASTPDPIYKRLGGPTISASGAPAFLATLNTNSHAIFRGKMV